MTQLNLNSCVKIFNYRRQEYKLNLLTGLIFSFFLTLNCLAQTTTANSFLLGTVQSTEMAQRVFQYEIVLGRELSSDVGVCIDGELSYAWMLPEKAETELSLKAIARVKSIQRVCGLHSGSDSNASIFIGNFTAGNFTAGIRTVISEQLQAAQVLEQTRKSTRVCLNSQSQDTYKSCIQMALPVVPSDFQWTRWFSLFERRATLLALNQVEKMPPQVPSTREIRPP